MPALVNINEQELRWNPVESNGRRRGPIFWPPGSRMAVGCSDDYDDDRVFLERSIDWYYWSDLGTKGKRDASDQ